MAPVSSHKPMPPLSGVAFVKKLAKLSKISRNQSAHFALAVSGGADSLSLMALAAVVREKNNHWDFSVLTVNHGLRPAAVQETRYVSKLAKAMGLPCKILTHKGAVPENDIQSAARNIRYGLMSEWCVKNKVTYLVTAHHLEDQAETFLLRLARGSGLDGLSGMQSIRNYEGVALLRPFLDVPRECLHQTTAKAGLEPISDPSNSNRRFARVRIRNKMDLLSEEGMTAARLADTAGRLLQARQALEQVTENFMQTAVRLDEYGIAYLTYASLRDQPEDILRRTINRLLTPYGGYPPRAESVQRILDEVFLKPRPPKEGGKTINGFVLRFRREGLLIFREISGLPEPVIIKPGGVCVWDNGISISVAKSSVLKGMLQIKPLGSEGLKAISKLGNNVPKNLPAAALHALPSVWLTYRKKSSLLAVRGVLEHADIEFQEVFRL
ncbi:MAG: tRNA lysidine(34) synthetase TilS [Alphaproteobacteria bacterium]|nr:tRNA lysidine(34) synthetase TilS [Alphaproteobacteria bacterium]